MTYSAMLQKLVISILDVDSKARSRSTELEDERRGSEKELKTRHSELCKGVIQS